MAKNLSLKIDPQTRDYQVDDDGKIVNDFGLLTPAYFRLRTPRNEWLYAPNARYGSDFKSLKKNQSAGSQNRVTNIAERALAPLIDQNRATETEVNVADVARHGVSLDIKITDSQGEVEEIELFPIGRG